MKESRLVFDIRDADDAPVMAHLLSLQNAYAANARVMSTINQMYQSLMQAI